MEQLNGFVVGAGAIFDQLAEEGWDRPFEDGDQPFGQIGVIGQRLSAAERAFKLVKRGHVLRPGLGRR